MKQELSYLYHTLWEDNSIVDRLDGKTNEGSVDLGNGMTRMSGECQQSRAARDSGN